MNSQQNPQSLICTTSCYIRIFKGEISDSIKNYIELIAIVNWVCRQFHER
jgi:hypothetical protein